MHSIGARCWAVHSIGARCWAVHSVGARCWAVHRDQSAEGLEDWTCNLTAFGSRRCPGHYTLCVLLGLAENAVQPSAVTESEAGNCVWCFGVVHMAFGGGRFVVNLLQLDCSPFG